MGRMILLVIFVGTMLYACGGGGGAGSAGGTTPTGDLAFFVTDDMSSYKQLITTINKVQIVNPSSSGTTCDVLTTPVMLDVSKLSSIIQFINASTCASVSYSGIHIEFDKNVKLMDKDNAIATCSFTSYKDNNDQLNAFLCKGNNCSLDIKGAVNVLANQNNKLALDFNLKEFEVKDFPLSSCSVTMKATPLSDSDVASKKTLGYKEGISGYISNLNTSAKTFIIVKGNKNFTILYSGISQQNIDQLLRFAGDNNLKVNIESSSSDLNAGTYTAFAVFVKVGGNISSLNISKNTFFLTYQKIKTITIDYSEASINDHVEGQLSNGSSVEAKLNGYSSNYTSNDVEVKDAETEN